MREEYEIEPDNSGVPKNFVIRCNRCRWARISSGVAADISDLHEVKLCPTCGRWRQFRCKNCGFAATMRRLNGNTPAKKPDSGGDVGSDVVQTEG